MTQISQNAAVALVAGASGGIARVIAFDLLGAGVGQFQTVSQLWDSAAMETTCQ